MAGCTSVLKRKNFLLRLWGGITFLCHAGLAKRTEIFKFKAFEKNNSRFFLALRSFIFSSQSVQHKKPRAYHPGLYVF